jgi:TetR/AcrR family transcriptional repressor of nem operon
MPRKPEFDRDTALQNAMKLFWRRGYHATSLPDLLAVTGLSRSSFYAAFTDKRSLYAECLVLFGRRTRDILRRGRDPQQPLAALAAFFRRTLCEVPGHRVDRGCMMVNTVLELADSDDGLRQLAVDLLARMEADFEAVFTEAAALGHVDSRFTPAQRAAHLMTLNQGLRVQSRQKLSPEQLEATLVTGLSLAGVPVRAGARQPVQ